MTKAYRRLSYLKSPFAVRLFILSLFLVLLFFLNLAYKEFISSNPDPIDFMTNAVIGTLIFLFILVFVVSYKISNFLATGKNQTKRAPLLRRKIVVLFSLGAAMPATLTAIFSIYFFNINVQSWFDDKITNLLNQSVQVGDSYIKEHTNQLKETSISIAEDISNNYTKLIHNPKLFSKVINAQAEIRNIDEALVFRRDTNIILAQTSLSFSLSVTSIPYELIERANSGEVVYLPSGPYKIRVLIRVRDQVFLLIGKLVDSHIVNHISRTEGAVVEYQQIKNSINYLQIQFALIFFAITFILITFAVIFGRKVAEHIVGPIRTLVLAAEKVKNGDFTVSIPENKTNRDELRILSSAFNRMVLKLNKQQKELFAAQSALAWADVARRVAHEIKNPLTPIQLSADRLRIKFQNQVEDTESFSKYINNIIGKTNDIKRIVSEFVDYARMPAPQFMKCNIVSFLFDIVDSHRIINDSISYKYISNHKEIDFACDKTQFNQIMENIFKNSEEAFPENFANKIIEVSLIKKDNMLNITLSDNGPGLKGLSANDIIKPYFTNKKTGSGLGLSIVDRIVKDHFGTMEIMNVDKGFLISLNFDIDLLISKVN